MTHERPHTRNPRDPRHIPARKSPHVSPKGNNPEGAEGDDVLRVKAAAMAGIGKPSSFPSLPMSLNGWGVGRGGGSGGHGGTTRGMKDHSMITMAKPKEILVEGFLR